MRLGVPNNPAKAGKVQDIEVVRRARRAAVIRVVFAVLVFAGFLVVAGGWTVLLMVATHAWPAGADVLTGIWFTCSIMFCFGALLVGAFLFEGHSIGGAGGFWFGACVACCVLSWTLPGAVTGQMLHDRGVAERAVVAVSHYQCLSNPDGPCSDDYSYTLRSIAGSPIRPDLDLGSSQLTVGRQVTVLVDPRGQIAPSLNANLPIRRWWITNIVIGSVEASFLMGLAWTLTRGRRRPAR